MKLRENFVVYIAAIVASAVFLLIYYFAGHVEFFLHLAAIPLEVLVVIFIIEKLLDVKEKSERKKQLVYIKGCIFRSDMRSLFAANFAALKIPAVSIPQIKDMSLEELKQAREDANAVEYKSLDAMEPVIMEYVNAQPVWKNFMDLAMGFGFDAVLKGMVYIMHFINDVKVFKENHPDKPFIHEAEEKEWLMKKVDKVLGDGIRSFMDFAIELKQNQPDMFLEMLSDYESL
ncbi:hypothetical protein ACFLXN_01735 [Chloroflexota bacterium]